MESVGSPILTIIAGRLTQTPYKVPQGTAGDSHASYKRDEPCWIKIHRQATSEHRNATC